MAAIITRSLSGIRNFVHRHGSHSSHPDEANDPHDGHEDSKPDQTVRRAHNTPPAVFKCPTTTQSQLGDLACLSSCAGTAVGCKCTRERGLSLRNHQHSLLTHHIHQAADPAPIEDIQEEVDADGADDTVKYVSVYRNHALIK